MNARIVLLVFAIAILGLGCATAPNPYYGPVYPYKISAINGMSVLETHWNPYCGGSYYAIVEAGRDADGRAITASVRLPDPSKLGESAMLSAASPADTRSRLEALAEEVRQLRLAVSEQ